ncbi:hypothetical protein GIB67_005690 [Kingdonia uniflora]|uniref:Protein DETOXIFICATION n=1 Tax=Kingdonia uniflora TaxID=39325 RepID=A0A7J7NIL0_9MAGN|nr:hypothetical protein GIB67_005690 [Kingdonia uniflora]
MECREEQELLLPQETSKKLPLLFKQFCQESAKLWQIAGPAIFSQVSLFSMTVITQAFAGHLSDLDLAAISIATTVIIPISFGFLLGMASAFETLCGQAYGAKQYQMLGIYLQRSWVVMFLCSILVLPIYVFATSVLKFIGQTAEVAEKFGVVAVWLIPLHFAFVFQFPLQRFLQCQGKNNVVAWVSGGALVVHVLVTWLVVYKLRGGIVATTISLDLSWWITVLGLFVFVSCGGCRQCWNGFSVQAFSGLWEFLKLSVASGFMLCFENWYYRILIIASGVPNLNSSEVSVDALSIWVRVATELGAGNGKGAKFATIVSAMSSMIVGLFFWSLIMAFNDKFALIFTSTTGVLDAVNKLAVLLALTILLNSIQPVLSGVAVGSGWQSLVAYISVGSYYVIGVPLGIFLGIALHFGITGMWVGMISGTVVQTLILTFITIRYNWEKEAEKASMQMGLCGSMG